MRQKVEQEVLLNKEAKLCFDLWWKEAGESQSASSSPLNHSRKRHDPYHLFTTSFTIQANVGCCVL